MLKNDIAQRGTVLLTAINSQDISPQTWLPVYLIWEILQLRVAQITLGFVKWAPIAN